LPLKAWSGHGGIVDGAPWRYLTPPQGAVARLHSFISPEDLP
jgi:hypothetical protein